MGLCDETDGERGIWNIKKSLPSGWRRLHRSIALDGSNPISEKIKPHPKG
jgi:hypothetical protein